MTDRTPHVGENAELFALGQLSQHERRAVDEHIARCGECRRRVGEAEEAVLAMDAQFAPVEPPASLGARLRASRVSRAAVRGFSWYALVAACLIGLLPSVPLSLMLRDAREGAHENVAVQLAMVRGHFSHAQFVPLAGRSAPSAKLLFARDGSWFYVIVGAGKPFEVSAFAGGRRASLGWTRVDRDVSTLFRAHPPAGTRFVYLRDEAGNDIAQASTTFR